LAPETREWKRPLHHPIEPVSGEGEERARLPDRVQVQIVQGGSEGDGVRPTFEVVRNARTGFPERVLMNGEDLDGVTGVTVIDDVGLPPKVEIRFTAKTVTQFIQESAP
jgi:hypothetical protein